MRTVPLLPEVVDRLRRHRAEQAQRLLRLGIRAIDDDVVCDGSDGTPLKPSKFSHAAKRLAAEAGLEGVRLHDLRHAVATMLAASGSSAAVTSKLLGNASVAFTLQTYTHPDDEELDRAGVALQRALGAG